jgi:hypothetical protein
MEASKEILFCMIEAERFESSSEGIQIGSVGSAMGVVGAWSAFHHGEGVYRDGDLYDC